jgi:lipopolysaccharide transport protein LptA
MKARFFFLGMIALFAIAIGFVPAVLAAEPAKPAGQSGKPFKRKSQKTDITSSRMEYDYAESTIVFEENVKVVDEEYTLTADRIIVFLEGTNEVRQIRAIGHVVIVNGDRTGRCPEAVYTRKNGEIVMSGPNDTAVQLTNKEDKIWGRKITIWLDDQRMVCVPARLTLIDSNPAKATGTDKNGEEKRVLP